MYELQQDTVAVNKIVRDQDPDDAQNRRAIEAPGLRVMRSGDRRWLEWFVPAALCALMLAQLLLSVRQLSQTVDEATHLYAGYRYWKCADFGFGYEHPPLAKLVAAAPLLSMNLQVNCGAVAHFDEAPASVNWLYRQDWPTMLSRARAAVSVFALGLCLLLWRAARRMFGLTTASIAVVLLVFEPNVLAHGALVATDMVATFALLLAVYAFYLWASSSSQPYLLFTGLASGLALVAKHSGIAIVPILCLLAVGDAYLQEDGEQPWRRTAGRNLLAVLLIGIIAAGVIWAAYGLRFAARPDHSRFATAPERVDDAHSRFLTALESTHVLPEAYLEGLGEALGMAQNGRTGFESVFLLGRVYPRGQWFFFPVAMSIKYTAAFLVLILGAAIGAKSGFRQHRRELLFIALPGGIFLLACMLAGMNSGIRHTFPMLPFLLIFVAAGWAQWARRLHWVAYAVLGLIVLHAASSLHAFPNYLSYANELWGGPNNLYKYLPNSDWGQAYKQVKLYLDQHPASPCWLATDYQVDPRYYGVPCQPFGFWFREGAQLHMRGTVIVSSTFRVLQGGPGGALSAFLPLTPKDQIGGSAMLVYAGDFDTSATVAKNERLLVAPTFYQGRLDAALVHAQNAVTLAPASAEAHRIRCVILAASGQIYSAISECEHARELARKDPFHPIELPHIENNMQVIRAGSGLLTF